MQVGYNATKLSKSLAVQSYNLLKVYSQLKPYIITVCIYCKCCPLKMRMCAW